VATRYSKMSGERKLLRAKEISVRWRKFNLEKLENLFLKFFWSFCKIFKAFKQIFEAFVKLLKLSSKFLKLL
jgi:hypothetical protein